MSRELIEVTLDKYNFSFYIVRLPEEVIYDKLAIASPDTGLVSRIEYQNFIFNETIVNIERLFKFIAETTGGDREEQIEIRNDIESLVYGVNPGFDPQTLVVTKSGLIRPVTEAVGVPLPNNGDWDKDIEDLNPYVFFEEFEILPDDIDELPEDKGDNLDFPPSIPTVKKKWTKTGLVLKVRKFSKDDIHLLLKKNINFPSEIVYKVYIAKNCIVDSEDLFILIEQMKLTEDIPKETIIEDLYNICISVNPFLNFTDVDLETLVEPPKTDRVTKRKRSKKLEPESDRRFSDVSKPELLTLSSRVKDKVIGQEEAIDQIVETIQVASCGLRDPEKPIAVYMLCGTTGVGKCHGKGTLIRMFDGTVKKVEDIQKGEILMGDDSSPREVLSLARGKDDMFNVVPVKGDAFTCNKAHILSLKNTVTKEIVNITIEDYLKQNKNFKHLHKLYRVGVDYPEKKVLVDPYFIGLWLGDGNSKNTGVTTADTEIVDYLNSYASHLGLKIRINHLKENASDTYFITAGNCKGPSEGRNRLLTDARKYGLMNTEGDKFIPRDYLINSREVRLQVLAGLIDSDGYLIHNVYEYVTKSDKLSDDVLTLSRSLGFAATHRKKEVNGAEYHRIFISGDISEIPVKLIRKKAAPRKQKKDVLVTGFSLEYIGKGDYYGFSISGNRLYLLNDFTVTHNTLAAKVLAEELCGTREALIRIDCSEYTEQHAVQKLMGAPPSYVGYEDGGFLTNAVQKHPFSVVLFDEIEKAHAKLFDLLLQIMDDSRLTDGKGNVTSFKDCVILLTSNVGVSESEAVKGTMGFGDEAVLTDDRRKGALKSALKKRFRPEFLNRIDSTISFRSLNHEDAIKVSGLILEKVSGYLQNRNITATFSDAVKEMVFDKGFSKKYGARPLERTVEREVIKPLAQMILRDEIEDGTDVVVDFVNGELVVNLGKENLLNKA